MKLDGIDPAAVTAAFALVPLAALKASGADPPHLNAIGGAIALGHPLGASGATLMRALRRGRALRSTSPAHAGR